MRSQIEIAVAAALSVNLPLYWKFTRRDSGGSPNPFTSGEAGLLALVLGCYVAASFIARTLERRRFARRVPSWLWISALGAALIVVADYSFGITYGIGKAEKVAKEWLVLTVYTSPVTALVYYSKAAVGLLKKWHAGQGDDLRIVQR
jgi:hypothetical protein